MQPRLLSVLEVLPGGGLSSLDGKDQPGLMDLSFRCMISAKLPCSGCCWCCKGVGNIFLAHFGPLNTNQSQLAADPERPFTATVYRLLPEP